MKYKIVFLIILTAFIVAGTSCSDDFNTNKDTLSSAEFSGSENVREKNLYGYDEPVHIKVAYNRSSSSQYAEGESLENNAWMNLYRENNIFPEVLFEAEGSQFSNWISLAIVSGDYPDIMWADPQDYINWIDMGVIADITDAFEEYASDELKSYVNADGGESMKAVMHEGRMYGIPYVNDPYNNAYCMFIRQDWLDNLGLEVPKTMEDFRKVAYEFTYSDPDRDGEDDTYGFVFNGVNPMEYGTGNLTSFFSGFGAYLGYDGTAYVQYEKDKITWGGTNAKGMKAGLKLLQDMYKEGTISRDIITMNSAVATEETYAGRVGMWLGSYWGGGAQAALLKVDSRALLTVAPIPDGLNQGGSNAFFIDDVSPIYVVSSKCENPEVLVKIANLSVQKQQYYSDEAECQKYTGGFARSKNALLNLPRPFAGHLDALTLAEAFRTGDTSALNYDTLMDMYETMTAFQKAVAEGTVDAEDPVILSGAGRWVTSGPVGAYMVIAQQEAEGKVVYNQYDAAPSESMAKYQSLLNAQTGEIIIRIILGEPVELYDSFLETWYSCGGQEMIDDAQDWYDSNK